MCRVVKKLRAGHTFVRLVVAVDWSRGYRYETVRCVVALYEGKLITYQQLAHLLATMPIAFSEIG